MKFYKLLIKPNNPTVAKFYENHSTYNKGDSGLDLFSLENNAISPNSTYFLDLGIQTEMLEIDTDNDTSRNVSYFLYPRSSISKTDLILHNSTGIIDAGYRGNLKAALRNLNNTDLVIIEEGQRLVQICAPNLEPFQFELVPELSKTKRGSGGFGSTNLLVAKS
jgi:dUTP pyrophosphatase